MAPFQGFVARSRLLTGSTAAALLLLLSLSVTAPQAARAAPHPIDCLSEVVQTLFPQRSGKRPVQRLPADFGPAAQRALLQKFADDGRPILVVTDSYSGQKSGVVTVMDVLQRQIQKLTGKKVAIHYVTPEQFPNFKVDYQDLLVGVMPPGEFQKIMSTVNPQAVHIAVEGPLGHQAKHFLDSKGIPYTTAYHTAFPEYAEDTVVKAVKSETAGRIANKLTNFHLQHFHRNSEGIMVPTETMAKRLIADGYDPNQILYWSHGVETDLFHPSMRDPKIYEGLPGPISVFIGRVAVEKNLEDFLRMDIPGTKVVVGGGPELDAYQAKYPNVVFKGRQNYTDLPKYYASADVFVFPSLTDTFGLVQLEALASGTPVVAYKVQGPVDVIRSEKVGTLAEHVADDGDKSVRNLTEAWHKTVPLKREDARAYAEQNSWEKSTVEFMYFLKRLPEQKPKVSQAPQKR